MIDKINYEQCKKKYNIKDNNVKKLNNLHPS